MARNGASSKLLLTAIPDGRVFVYGRLKENGFAFTIARRDIYQWFDQSPSETARRVSTEELRVNKAERPISLAASGSIQPQ